MNEEQGMRLALDEARRALIENEVPIGAVVVKGDTVVSRAHNDCVRTGDPTRHAECIALKEAYQTLKSLDGCTLFVTVEPCAMCAGTMLLLRLPRLVFGAFSPVNGCCGSKVDLTDHWFDASAETVGGVLESECSAMLSRFFSELRTN